MNLTIVQIIKAYKNKQYFYNPMGLNIFGIRTSDNFTNKFDDFIGIISNFGVPELTVIPGTTKGGWYGAGAVFDPIPGGIAVIEPGQYLNIWEFHDTYDGWLKYPYMQQIGTFRIWRDGNKDKIIDHVCGQSIDNAGLNLHRMSWNGISGQDVNNWSEGCQGSEEPEYKKILPPIRQYLVNHANKFAYTLFEYKDFI